MGFIPSFYRKGNPTRTTWELKHCLSLARIVVRKLSWTRCLSGIQLSYFLGSLGQHWIMSEKTQMAPPSGDTEERQPASKIGWGKHSSLRVWGQWFLWISGSIFHPVESGNHSHVLHECHHDCRLVFTNLMLNVLSQTMHCSIHL